MSNTTLTYQSQQPTFSRYYAFEFGLPLIPRSFVGFPSDLAAFNWLDVNAKGDCCYILNSQPYPMIYTFGAGNVPVEA